MALPAVATMLLAASCSSQDTENIEAAKAPETHTIPFEAIVNSPSQTRATLNAAGGAYVFQEGDKLFVYGGSGGTLFTAELTLNPEDAGKSTGARFTGDLTYSGTAPISSTPVRAALKGANDLLLPATATEFVTAGGEVTFPTTAIAASPAEAVKKYSYFDTTADATYGDPTFTLDQLSSFIDFTIALEDGTTAGTELGVTISNGGSAVRTGTVTAADDGFGGVVAKFTAAFMGSGYTSLAAPTTLSGATVKLGSKDAISFGGTTTLAPNKVYQVSKGYYDAGAKYTLTATYGSSSKNMTNRTLPYNTTLVSLLGSSLGEFIASVTDAEVTSGENVKIGTISVPAGDTPVTISKSGTSTINVTMGAMTANVTITVTKQAPAPEGAINGKFSVSSTNQVYFSKGNLWAKCYASNIWSWEFAPNQWSYVGNNSANINIIGEGYLDIGGYVYVDLFGWSTNTSTYYGINNSMSNDAYSGDFVDWGATMGTGWRTLTADEWIYVLGNRSASTINGTENGRFAKATVADKSGLILFPDSYTHPDGVTLPENVNKNNGAFTSNTYDATAWGKMEDAGCVFLPAAGNRSNKTVYSDGSSGNYWTSTSYSDTEARSIFFNASSLSYGFSSYADRKGGLSVRLVRAVE